MRKIALHWQILIALILSIVYGIVFPTSYVLDDDAFKYLKNQKTEAIIVESLHSLKDQKFTTRKSFDQAIAKVIPEEIIEEKPLLSLLKRHITILLSAMSVGWEQFLCVPSRC